MTKTKTPSTARRTVGTLRTTPNMTLKASECNLTQAIERAYYRMSLNPTSAYYASMNKTDLRRALALIKGSP
jgi:hypothetical protein